MGVIFLRNKVSGAVVDAYSIGGASPELVAAFLTAADGTTEGEYFRTGGVEDDFSMFTFARSDNATMFDSTGTLVWAPHNLLTYSEDFSNAIWVSTETSVSSNATTAPDGTLTADKLVESSATATHIIRGPTTFPDNISTIFAMCVKDAGDGRYIVLGNGNRSGQEAYATFNPVNGALENSGGGDFVSAGSTPLGNGWYLCFIELKAVSGDANDFVRITLSDIALADETRSYTGDGTSGVYIWGAHLYRSDLGGMADNPDQTVSGLEKYVPTTSAAVYLSRRNAYYYNSGWTKGGLRLERNAATNLSENSTPATADQNLTGVTVTENALDSPLGTNQAFLITEDTSNSAHQTQESNSISWQAGTEYCVWAIVKDNGRGFAYIRAVSPAFSDNPYVIFDLTNKDIETENVGGGSAFTNKGVIDLGGGWLLIYFAKVADATTSRRWTVGISDDGSNTSYTGDGSSGLYIAHMQVELGSFPTSPIITTGSTVTRAAENLSIAQANYPTADDATPHWFLIDVRMWDEDTRQDWLDLENNTSGFFFRLETQKARVIARTPADGVKGVIVLNPSSTAFTQFDLRLAHRFTTSEHGGSANGESYVSTALTEVPAVPSQDLNLTADDFNGFIREIRAGLGEPATTDLEAASA